MLTGKVRIQITEEGFPDLFSSEDRCFYHVVACNWPLKQKSTLRVLAWHNSACALHADRQRGQAENSLKEYKGGFGLDRVRCGHLEANALFFRIGLIAYN